MSSVSELRKQAKAEGLKGYSRLPKPQLAHLLETVVVCKGDTRAVRHLGTGYLRKCKVHQWESKGTGRYRRWLPQAWIVPRFRLGEITPVSSAEARARREVSSESAKRTYRGRMERAAAQIGALPTSRTAHAFAFGWIDEDAAEFIAFKTYYRHEQTDYDARIASGEPKEFARSDAAASKIPADWEDYLAEYGFDSSQARAMAKVLRAPQSAHPVWFKEAEIALRRYEVPLGFLSYERIREAVDRWRFEREHD